MKKVKFITLLGTEVEIEGWTLDKNEVEIHAERFFGEPVVCRAGIFGNSSACSGWQCRSKEKDKVVGYMSLALGVFHNIEDYEYGIAVFVPLSEEWAEVSQSKLRFKDGKIEMLF